MRVNGARVIGAGLIGTSIALRLKELGWEVKVADSNPVSESLARDLLGSLSKPSNIEVVVIATPPNEVIDSLIKEFKSNPQAIFIDVASVKTNTQLEVDRYSELSVRFVGTHPIAGREVTGAQGARSDLFDGRAWILTPSPSVPESIVGDVESLITSIGATPYRMTPREHDRLFANISHLPQILSTALAGAISGVSGEIELAGQGLRDMLRISGSNAALWSEILVLNRAEVIASLSKLQSLLKELESSIAASDKDSIIKHFEVGNRVQAKVSSKHGGSPRQYSYLSVVIDDRPGQLASLFNECAKVEANIEDLSLEHSPKQETGLIRLALSESDANNLLAHLLSRGWRVHKQ